MAETVTTETQANGDEARSGEPSDRVARLLAFHLPQFHPIPENDEWWGRGFTEWTNVARARPLYPGHEQPKLPSDLGFYDLRLPEARAAQAELARASGIEGFCYWHYWLHGRRLLERPVNEILASGEPDFPFCLGWANHSWVRRWLGGNRETFVEQRYSAEDDQEHARWLAEAFADPRYVRVGGRPLFLVFHPQHLPDPRRTTGAIREACARRGLPDPYLVGAGSPEIGMDMRSLGFDITEFHEPHLLRLPMASWDGSGKRRLLYNLKRGVPSARLKVYRYRDAFEQACAMAEAVADDYPHLPCCFSGWDNTPRRGKDGIVMVGGSPELFAEHLGRCIARVADRPAEERIVFINAWNEWAEGMYLEPDLRHGSAYLEAVARVVGRPDSPRPTGGQAVPAGVAGSGERS
ncbi:glycosyltransferase WbsX family protein [Tautonia sociabilis]|uniref:Lipopolysaccharide biosynthesis protein n=1 Tax=Tautonia sociabilis TaxID=2080755 RepID=A0A432MFI7_9BACT|nr:glycoside hydrolase family 99-like domain-containing protein [Tautonia sociabilis]RUL84930.1 lipopolysaccharide biosynthesis protein [Tautonia sociabilis]